MIFKVNKMKKILFLILFILCQQAFADSEQIDYPYVLNLSNHESVIFNQGESKKCKNNYMQKGSQANNLLNKIKKKVNFDENVSRNWLYSLNACDVALYKGKPYIIQEIFNTNDNSYLYVIYDGVKNAYGIYFDEKYNQNKYKDAFSEYDDLIMKDILYGYLTKVFKVINND